jgi:hypothetical protein
VIHQSQAVPAPANPGLPDPDNCVVSLVHHLSHHSAIISLHLEPNLALAMNEGVSDQLGHDQLEVIQDVAGEVVPIAALDQPPGERSAGTLPR